MKKVSEADSPRDLLAPRFWPTWLGVAVTWPLHLLPYRLQLFIGRALGRVLRHLVPYRRQVVRTNLQLCFPELDERQRRQLEVRCYASLGMSFMEMLMAIRASDRFMQPLGTIQGLEHLEQAQAQGQGVLLLSGHFCSVDFAGRIFYHNYPVCFTYQELRNRLSDHVFTQSRKKYCKQLIHRHDIRGFIRALKAGEVIWYAPDQSQKRENSVFAPFFGIPANTLTATTKLARLTGCRVMPFEIERLPDARGYALTVHPPLEDFPGESELADATRFNALLEEQIRKRPEQYLWTHRRFKHRPEGEPKLYPQKPRRLRYAKRKQAKTSR